MLAIRMQRTGRKGHAQFRVVVQDAHRSPTSGNIVAQIGHYNPHSKQTVLDKEKAEFYISHGAQPSPRAVKLLSSEGVKLPDWVKVADATKQRTTRNADKRRSTRPEQPEAPAPTEEPAAEVAAEEVAVVDAPTDQAEESVVEAAAEDASAVDAATDQATPAAELAEAQPDEPVSEEAPAEEPEPQAEDVSEEK